MNIIQGTKTARHLWLDIVDTMLTNNLSYVCSAVDLAVYAELYSPKNISIGTLSMMMTC